MKVREGIPELGSENRGEENKERGGGARWSQQRECVYKGPVAERCMTHSRNQEGAEQSTLEAMLRDSGPHPKGKGKSSTHFKQPLTEPLSQRHRDELQQHTRTRKGMSARSL